MSLRIRYSFIFLLVIASACNNPDSWDCFQVAGKTKVERREFNNFSQISVFNKLDVEIIQTDHYAVEIQAGENLIPGITTKIAGSRLEIENNNSCELLRNSDKIALVRIFFDSIDNIEVFTTGTLKSIDTIRLKSINLSKRSNGDMFLNLKADNVFIYSNEYGDAIFSGNIKSVSIRQEGIGLVDFSQCNIENGYVITRGPGKTKVKVKNEISGDVSGNGILEVYGDPQVRQVQVKDQGQLIYIDP